MGAPKTGNVRNVVLVGQGGVGKTSLAEAMLHLSGKTARLGGHDGTKPTLDYDPEEVKRAFSISTTIAPIDWKGARINVLDAPCYPDFIGDAFAAMSVCETALFVVDAEAGPQPTTVKLWYAAEDLRLARAVFVNRLSRSEASFATTMDLLQERFGTRLGAVTLPWGEGEDFDGIIDLVRMRAEVYYDDEGKDVRDEDIPAELLEQAEEYHQKLIESVAESDEALMEKFFEGEELTVEEINAAIRKATINCTMNPVLCGTSYRNKGVQPLLDAVVEYMPSPLDIPAIKGVDPDDPEKELVRHPSDDEPFSALAFKIMTDPFVGKLAFCRVYSGVLESGSYAYNSSKRKRERVGRLVMMHANHREEVETVYTGDICGIVGLKDTTTADTLCDETTPIILESMEFPDPVIQVAIEPKTKAGQDKMTMALVKLAEEDPTFKTYTDQQTGQTIIAGMGELHLEIIVDRLMREFKVEATVGKPQVAYRETIRKAAKAEGRYVRQTGGHGQFGHCWIEIEPVKPGEGYSFENKIVGGVIPKEFIAPIDAGIREAAQSGILGGFEVVDFKATVYDGSYHDVDSSEMAFKIAGSMAFKEALAKADPCLLEPMMKVEVIIPEQYMGDVIGDISSRRGRIEGMDARMGEQTVHAYVPLSEMFGYATDLRSRTQGRGLFTMQFDHYEEVPKSIAEKVTGSRKSE